MEENYNKITEAAIIFLLFCDKVYRFCFNFIQYYEILNKWFCQNTEALIIPVTCRVKAYFRFVGRT